MDEGMLDGVYAMTTFLSSCIWNQIFLRVPLMIDSSKWEIIEARLKVAQGKYHVSSISLKRKGENFIRQAKLVKRYGMQ
jgi:5-methyltetrahydrofolate--homocysteine methyltransferase